MVDNKIFIFKSGFFIQLLTLFNIMIKRILQLLCIILLFCVSLKAQPGFKKEETSDFVNYNCIDQLHEEVYLHLNRWSIVVGERLYFKAYLIHKNISIKNSSKVLYIEIFDNHNKLKAFGRSNIDSGFCISSILIPDSLKTGLYKIIAYTNLMRNFPASSFLHSSLIIIGMKNEPTNNALLNYTPDSINNQYQLTTQPDQTLSRSKISNMFLNGKVDKQVYNRKEKVVLTLDLKDADSKPLNGNFSVSVFEKLPESYLNLNNDISLVNSVLSGDRNTRINISDNAYKELLFNNNEYSKWLEKVKNHVISFQHKSETKGFLFEGTLFEKTSQKAEPGKTIFLSTPGSYANLKYSTTDSSGKFIFALDKIYDNCKLIMNINGNIESKDYYYVLENKQIIDSSINYEAFKIDDLMKEFIQKSKKLAVINKVYYKSNGLKTDNKINNSHNHFYGKPVYSVLLSEYIELDDFTDISKNLLPGVKFKKKKDKYSVAIRNILTNQDYPDQNCLVLLNNIPFYDYDYLSTLGSNQIDRIDVDCRHLAYGNLDFYGILSVYTKDKVMISNRQALIYENKVENLPIAHVAEKETDNIDLAKLPDFKQVLFWKPDLALDVNGNAKLEFNTSDLATEYIIDVEGLTDNGIPVSKKILFKVQ